MKVNRKFKVLSKFGMLKRNMAKVLIGYMKINAVYNTGKPLKDLITYNDEVAEKVKKFAEDNSDKYKSIISFMTSQVCRVLVKRETDVVLDSLLYFAIKRYIGRDYVKLAFTKRLYDSLERGECNLHGRIIKAKNYHKNKKGM